MFLLFQCHDTRIVTVTVFDVAKDNSVTIVAAVAAIAVTVVTTPVSHRHIIILLYNYGFSCYFCNCY